MADKKNPSTTPAGPAAPDTAPPSDVDTALAAMAQAEVLRARVAELEGDLASARAEIDAMRVRFDAAWKEREEEVAAKLGEAARAARRTKRPVADSRLRVGGVKLRPGDPIPEDVALETLPPGSFRFEEV